MLRIIHSVHCFGRYERRKTDAGNTYIAVPWQGSYALQNTIEKGRVEGRVEGVRLALIQSVKGVFLNGISVEFTSISLGLSEAEVEEILQKEDLIK